MRPERIPSLDGIRAVAISMVILLHTGQRYDWPNPGTRAASLLVGKGGGMWMGDGVGLFFVLSGFLITTLLLREYEQTERIDLGSFYLRRAFRILPPLGAYLLFAFAFCEYAHIPFQAQNFLSAIFFYRDYYFSNNLWITQHTWSLSVEEQFYLLWPVLLFWLLRTRGRSAAAKLACAIILVTPLLRISTRLLHIPSILHYEDLMFHCRMDALMCGCLVALCAGTRTFERWYFRLSKFWWVLPVQFYLVSLLLGDTLGVFYRKSVGFTIDSACMALFILWVSRNPQHWLGRVLNSRLFVAAGVLSYSAYLWQTFFLHHGNPSFLGRAPLCFVLIWCAAWLSYVAVEKPFLKLRRVIEARPRAQAVAAGAGQHALL